MTSTDADLKAGQALVRDVLVPYGQKPTGPVIETMTEQLIQLGTALLPDVAHLRPRSDAALHDWEVLITRGQDDTPLASWTYARGLARTVRTMLNLLALDAAL